MRAFPIRGTSGSHWRQTNPSDQFNVIVVIPARNEEDRIADCLRSIVRAVKYASGVVDRLAIVVVADTCTDQTSEVARSILDARATSIVVECELGNVALVRTLGVEVGRNFLATAQPERTWIANTDADTTVPEGWIADQVDVAARGICAVAGVVDIDTFEGHPPAARQFFAETYTALLPPAGDHPHVHAANLGFRLDAYDSAGGWGCLPRSEDRDLWTRLQNIGAHVASPTDLRVTTSGRAVGRVSGGFAHFLRQQVLDQHAYESHDEIRRTA